MSLFIRLSCDVLTDDQLLEVGIESAWLWTRGLLYAKRHMTDGVVPRGARFIVGASMTSEQWTQAAERLVKAGLWEVVEDGWRVPFDEWSKWQTTKDEIEAAREQRVAKATNAANRRWQDRRSMPGDAQALPEHDVEHPREDAHTPYTRPQTPEEGKTSSSCPERPADGCRTPAGQGSPEQDAAMDFPAKAGTFSLAKAKLREFADSYADGDEASVLRELKHARQWLVDHPARRKTPGRMPGFLGSWLARASDRRSTSAKQRASPHEARPQPAPNVVQKGGARLGVF